jgi:hypothetical protein
MPSYKRASVAFGSLVGRRHKVENPISNPAAPPQWELANRKGEIQSDKPNLDSLSPLRAFITADASDMDRAKEEASKQDSQKPVSEIAKARKWLQKHVRSISVAMVTFISCLVANKLVATDMGFNGWLTLGVTGAVVSLLVGEVMAPCILLFLAVAFLLVCKVMTPRLAWSGFSKPLVVAIQMLLIVAKGLEESSLLSMAVKKLGKPTTLQGALVTILPLALTVSAFVTGLSGVTAIFAAAVIEWSKQIGVPAKRMLLPMNYAVMLGAATTLLGNSCNLILSSLQESMEPYQGRCVYFDVFMPARAGVPVAIVGLVVIICGAPFLPSDKIAADKLADKLKLFTATMRVPPGSTLVGKLVRDAGLNDLASDMFLVSITNQNNQTPVGVGPMSNQPHTLHRRQSLLQDAQPDLDAVEIHENDLLIFIGAWTAHLVPPTRIHLLIQLTFYVLPGSLGSLTTVLFRTSAKMLVVHGNNAAELDTSFAKRRLAVAVISPQSSLIDTSLAKASFSNDYGAAVIGVQRCCSALTT